MNNYSTINNFELCSNLPLVILDEGEIWDGEDANIVYWADIDVPLKCLSIPYLVDINGTTLKSKYINLIQNLGNKNVSGKSVKLHFKTTEHLSFWWLSLLSEKSPWKSKGIFDVFKSMILESILTDYSGREIVVFSNNHSLTKWLEEKVRFSGQKLIVNKRCSKINSTLLKWKSWLPHTLQASFLILRLGINYRSQLFKTKYPNNSSINNNSVNTVITYSDNLDIKKFYQGKVYSGYWNGLDEYLDLSNKKVNWLMLYVASKDFPSLKTALLARNKAFKNEDFQQVFFIEEFFSIKILFKILYRYTILFFRTLKLSSLLNDKSDVLFFLKADLLSSIRGVAAMDGCVKLSLLEESLNFLPINKKHGKGLYVYENQAWERALVYMWKRKTSNEIIGFQHVSGKFYDMRPFDGFSFSENNASYENELIPDKLLVTGVSAKSELQNNQFPKDKLFIVESLRNLYLVKSKNTEPKIYNKNKLVLLVVTDHLQNITEHQLKLVSECWNEISKKFNKVIIKPHPNCPVDCFLDKYNINKENSLIVENGPLSNLWNNVDVVFASNVTGASLESAYMGLPTIVSLNSNSFNMSPLRGFKDVVFTATAKDLKLALRNPVVSCIPDDYFYLDLSLKLWKNLLEN